jgi:RNA 2',3'-cyclic 3'-phosphodiesterase
MSDPLPFGERDRTRHAVFFAIRPDPATAARIVRLAQDLSQSLGLNAQPLASDRLHVSLYRVGEFVGPLPSIVVSEAKTVAATIAMAPFRAEFGHVASFGGARGKRALVLVGDDGVVGLMMLRQSLSLVMMKAGVGRRRQSSYTPHLTMMYTKRIDERAIEPIGWIANEFVLIDSLQGETQHVVVGRWPLRGP